MGHAANTPRSRPPLRANPVSPAPPRRRNGEEPRLLALILPVLVLSALAMLHVVSLARLSELEAESRRLERLTLEQTMRHGELMRERSKLTNTAVLFDYATKHGMVNPVTVKPVRVGVLPATKVYWALPGELPTQLPNLPQIGELPPVAAPETRRM